MCTPATGAFLSHIRHSIGQFVKKSSDFPDLLVLCLIRQDGMFGGEGELKSPNGSCQKGTWSKGLAHGQGSAFWADGPLAGCKYTGSW